MDVDESERLSRFLFFSRWFARETQRVKPNAFVPHPHIELSVSCTEGLDDSVVWQVGQETATSRKDKPTLHGRADLKAQAVRKQNLEVIRDDNPLYHANICGWEGEKAAQISKAQQMAAESSLVLLPSPDSPPSA